MPLVARFMQGLNAYREDWACLPWTGRALAFAALAVCFPAAWIGLATGVFLLLLVFSGCAADKRHWLITLFKHPVARAALLLWGFMCLSLAWSPVPLLSAWQGVWAYRELLFLALMLPFMDDIRVRRWMLRAFALGAIVVLCVSYFRWFGLLPRHPVTAFSGFTGHTGFSLLLATAALGALLHAGQHHGLVRGGALCLAAAALFNLYFINTGRTGQLAFLVALPCLLGPFLHIKRPLLAMAFSALMALGLALVAYGFSPVVQKRFDGLMADLSGYMFEGKRQSYDGARLVFWENSLTLMAEHPLIGRGAASFATAYRTGTHHPAWAQDMGTTNPHNEYLMIGVQFGLVGLGLFLWLLWVQWRCAPPTPRLERAFLHGFLLMFMTGCLFNSLLLDNMEGHLYALLSAALGGPWAPNTPKEDAA